MLWALAACSSLQKLPETGHGGAEIAPGALELEAASACGGFFAGLYRAYSIASGEEGRFADHEHGFCQGLTEIGIQWKYSIRGRRQMTTLLVQSVRTHSEVPYARMNWTFILSRAYVTGLMRIITALHQIRQLITPNDH